MIRSLAIILTFQLVGEITSRGLGLPLPGPARADRHAPTSVAP